jgi:hypothetical protein
MVALVSELNFAIGLLLLYSLQGSDCAVTEITQILLLELCNTPQKTRELQNLNCLFHNY